MLTQHNAPHPGEILNEYMKGLSPERAAILTVDASLSGIDSPELGWVDNLINKKSSITDVTARWLAYVFDTTPEFWRNLQRQYDESVARKAGSTVM